MIVGPNGENIYPEEIESVINSHFLVTDSIVKENNGKLIAHVHFNRFELERRYHDLKDSINSRMAEIRSELKAYVNSKVSKSSQIAEIEEQETGSRRLRRKRSDVSNTLIPRLLKKLMRSRKRNSSGIRES